MKIQLALCWLVVTVLGAGCATGKNELVTQEKTADAQYTVRQITLPEQKTGPMPFTIRGVGGWGIAKNLAPVTVVSQYLEIIATSRHFPLRVKEGFLFKKGGNWHLMEVPDGEYIRGGCVGPLLYCAVLKDAK